MRVEAGKGDGRRVNLWRIAGWSLAALLLLAPLVAMQFTDEVNWTPFDFAFAAALLLVVGIAAELAVRSTPNRAYRLGSALALGAGFLLIWLNGAVGIIGSESNPLNLLYAAVLAVGVAGAFIVRFNAAGMARTLLAAAATQALIAAAALLVGLQHQSYEALARTFVLNAFFIVLLLASSWLFRAAAGQREGSET